MSEKALDFNLCILCQEPKSDQLIENPTTHEKVLKFVEEWARYGDLRYFELWSKLKGISLEELRGKQATWHRVCYQETVHTALLKRAKQRYV